MGSLPLDLVQVLEEEYVSLHGAEAPLYVGNDILDERAVAAKLAVTGAAKIVEALNGIITSDVPSPLLAASTTDPVARRRMLDETFKGEVRSWEAVRIERACYADNDVVDPAYAKILLTDCGLTGDAAKALNDIITTGAGLVSLARSRVITQTGSELLDQFDASALSPVQAAEVRRIIADEAFHGAVRMFRDVRLAAFYAKLHAKPDSEAHAALCLSGGGVRSATFALGVIEGLAAAGILDKFHYLSTVSGGGYIGSWLSSWARRHPDGLAGVQRDLVRADTGVVPQTVGKTELRPESKIDPEPRPLRHLRDYSSYLSPKLGLTSADTWAMGALYLRNLLLNVLVLVPILALLLALPRIFAFVLQRGDLLWHPSLLTGTPWLVNYTLILLAIAFGYVGLARPVRHGRESSTSRITGNAAFFWLCVLPMLGASVGIALFWARASRIPSVLAAGKPWAWIAAALITVWPQIIYYVRFLTATPAERRQGTQWRTDARRQTTLKIVFELIGAAAGAAVAALLFLLAATKFFPDPLLPVPNPMQVLPFQRVLFPATPIAEIYACFSVPVILFIFYVQATIFVGVSSRWNEDYDREWWGRAGGWLLMIALLCGAASYIAVFGPVLLYRSPLLLGSLGGISGIAAALVGFSGKTSGGDASGKSTRSGAAANAGVAIAVPLFALVLLAAISLATTELLNAIEAPPAAPSVTVIVPPKDPVAMAKYRAQFQMTATLERDRVSVKSETDKMPLVSVAELRGIRHLQRVHGTSPEDLFVVFGAAFAAWLLSLTVGVNRFSLHALYRSRLIRAYLGASRWVRDPDRFTGFDENDNLPMFNLRPELLWSTSVTDSDAFVQALAKPSGPIAAAIVKNLDKNIVRDLQKPPLRDARLRALLEDVNRVMISCDLTGNGGSPAERLSANRRAMDREFGAKESGETPILKPLDHNRPLLHVLSATLNLVGGQKLAWQERRAESFTISPLHAGSLFVGYRDASEYGDANGLSLGSAMAISGAAASPNMGYHSSRALSFLMTLFNVRLGAWLGNPGLAGRSTYRSAHPTSNLVTLFNEMAGRTNDTCKWVYLSDGGHFENLGIYEMVLRRCRFLVVSDCASDPQYTFDDFGNAIRKIRIDLGVPIEVRKLSMHPRGVDGKFSHGHYIAIATIRYSAIDENAKDGTLVYLKPGLYDEAYFPTDVYNYAQHSATFPHESTADQFFNESQFESYRALGRHIVNEICDWYPPAAPFDTKWHPTAKPAKTVADFVATVGKRLYQEAASQRMEIVATDGDNAIAHALGDGVRIRLRSEV